MSAIQISLGEFLSIIMAVLALLTVAFNAGGKKQQIVDLSKRVDLLSNKIECLYTGLKSELEKDILQVHNNILGIKATVDAFLTHQTNTLLELERRVTYTDCEKAREKCLACLNRRLKESKKEGE